MIIIGGDVSPSGFSERCLSQNPEILFKPSLKKFLAQAENVVINLETVITKSNQPIVKCGPNFKCKPDVAAGLKSLNILNCSLANNHIMDYGEIGLKDTMGCLNDEGINYWGAGLSINELASYCIFPMSGKRVAIVSIAEHEFSIISNNDAGAYGLDIIDNGTLISQLAQENDFVVVLYHGGVEHYRLPTPKQQKILRYFVDCGAGLVLCQHSHIIGATEKYKNGIICYGQGNFIFDNSKPRGEWWARGLLFTLALEGSKFEVKSCPIIQDNNGIVGIQEFDSVERKLFEQLDSGVSDIDFVRTNWSKWVDSKKVDYFSRLLGWSRVKRVLFRYFDLLGFSKYSNRQAMIRNVVECESHREALETYWSDRGQVLRKSKKL
tara:strand:+ start:274 stop:1413 length:1140 start_codon:yes stop_codon:yes gene_type:complete